jgi:hypothetical protein
MNILFYLTTNVITKKKKYTNAPETASKLAMPLKEGEATQEEELQIQVNVCVADHQSGPPKVRPAAQ